MLISKVIPPNKDLADLGKAKTVIQANSNQMSNIGSLLLSGTMKVSKS